MLRECIPGGCWQRPCQQGAGAGSAAAVQESAGALSYTPGFVEIRPITRHSVTADCAASRWGVVARRAKSLGGCWQRPCQQGAGAGCTSAVQEPAGALVYRV
jgi:hypothetical protein